MEQNHNVIVSYGFPVRKEAVITVSVESPELVKDCVLEAVKRYDALFTFPEIKRII